MRFRKDLKKRQGRNLVVLDIGSQFLKALFLEVDKDEEKGILRNWIKEKTIADLENSYPACQEVIAKLEKKTGLKAEQIFLGISGEIIKGISTTFCYKRENPNQKIDLPELRYLVQKFQWKAFEKIRKRFALETELPEAEVKLVNARIVNIKIDNHSIPNPLGFRGENICLSIFNTYISSKWLEVLGKLSSKLGLELIGISPFSYALFHCLDLEKASKGDILIIDVGGKITEITLIKNQGEIIETKTFQLGGEIFTKTLADFLELETNEAEKIKIKYSKGEISSEVKRKLEKLFASNIFSWGEGIEIVLDEFLKKYESTPREIFLCGEGSNLPDIKKVLNKKKDLQVKFILPQAIIRIENKTKFKNVPCLALANLALEELEATEFSSALKRVVRLIQG